MKNIHISVAVIMLLYITVVGSCKNKTMDLDITITKSVVTDAVSSGSGLAYYNNAAYLVGDDASYIAVLPKTDSGLYTRISIQTTVSIDRVAKAVKHDLEAALVGSIDNESYLFAFPSGSLSPYRDTMYAINVESKIVSFTCSLLPLYKAVKLKADLKDHQFNIEGAALVGDKLFLFNRGNNMAIIIAWTDFAQYVQKPTDAIPTFNLQQISLPVINNYAVGVSGACAINNNEMLFTASLEETHDNIADGAIRGSYIGVLRLNDKEEISLVALQQFKDAGGNIILDKLEAIEIIKQQGNNLKALALADNDDGKSKLFYMDIEKTTK